MTTTKSNLRSSRSSRSGRAHVVTVVGGVVMGRSRSRPCRRWRRRARPGAGGRPVSWQAPLCDGPISRSREGTDRQVGWLCEVCISPRDVVAIDVESVRSVLPFCDAMGRTKGERTDGRRRRGPHFQPSRPVSSFSYSVSGQSTPMDKAHQFQLSRQKNSGSCGLTWNPYLVRMRRRTTQYRYMAVIWLSYGR